MKDANLHVEGVYFKHKYFEHMRTNFQKRKRKLESEMRYTRKMISLGKLAKLKKGRRNERNVLNKGFLKQHKLQRIDRYSKLTILGFKSTL